MSITQLIDRTAISPKIKQFFWDVKDNRNVGRGIGGYYNVDQPATPYSTTSTTEVTIKSYTFTSSANTNYIRVRIWGYTTGANGSEVKLYINNTLESSLQVPNTSNGLLIDYIGSIPSSSSITVNVNGYIITSGVTLYITQVTIIAGFGLTSTTLTTILTINLGTNDTYTLYANGNFVYTVGIRWWAKGNRKTTANATIESNLVSEIQGYYSPSAGDDTDNNVFLTLRTGNYATSFTISGNVGASGDVIIITEIYAQIVLRGTFPLLPIQEKGIMSLVSRHVTIDGANKPVAFYINSSNGVIQVYVSSAGTDVTVGDLIFASNDTPSVYLHAWSQEDPWAQSVFLYINIIIIGA